jgi:protein-tyrosine phosphatase
VINLDDSEVRRLPLDGAGNFRDLGGYETQDGRCVKWGVIYRSGHLNNLTQNDLKHIQNLGIKSISDFRGPSEAAAEPDRIPDGISNSAYPVDVACSDLKTRIHAVIRGESEMDAFAYLTKVNRKFVTDYSGVFGRWLRDLAGNPDLLPQVFHCTAGKDRAGFASAILLMILGVPEDIVMTDYLKTNTYMNGFVEQTIKKIRKRTLSGKRAETIRPLLIADERYLQEALNAIRENWGSIEKYAEGGLKLSLSDIRTLNDSLLK